MEIFRIFQENFQSYSSVVVALTISLKLRELSEVIIHEAQDSFRRGNAIYICYVKLFCMQMPLDFNGSTYFRVIYLSVLYLALYVLQRNYIHKSPIHSFMYQQILCAIPFRFPR